MIFLTEESYAKVIDKAARKIVESKDLKIHFFHVGRLPHPTRLRSLFSDARQRHKLKSVMLTSLTMTRYNLIRSEDEQAYNRHNVNNNKHFVHEDIELLLENIRIGKNPVRRYESLYLPKLINEELDLVKKNDQNYLKNYVFLPADVPIARMRLSASNSKFQYAGCSRETFTNSSLASDDTIWPGVYK